MERGSPRRLRASQVRPQSRDSATGNDGEMPALGDAHSLSKRSAPYATAWRVQHTAKAKFPIPGGPAIVTGQRSAG